MGKESISRTTFAKGLTAGVIVAASLGMLSVGEYKLGGLNAPESGSASGAVGSGSYTPGTYTASAKGIDSDVSVTATFDETSITALEADVSGETAGIGAEIGGEMVEKVLAAQSADVDGVAGATITSDAFKAAVADCINQASGGAAEAETDTTEAEAVTEAAAETEAVETEAEAGTEVTAETEAATEAGTEDTAETEAATEAGTEAAEEAAAVPVSANTEIAAADAPFHEGTYTASADGIASDVTVTATFDLSNITGLELYVGGETPGIGAEVGPEMTQRILETQSADVDTVAGATVTSNAVLDALSDCIRQAQGRTGNYMEKEEVESLSESPDGPFASGVYTATTEGIDSDIVVTMTFDETSILDISVDVSGETAGIGAMIGDDLAGRILAAQSADVDIVSGATITSDAVIEAAADCIAQAAQAKESVVVIGGADGPTSVFIAGTLEDETETETETVLEMESESETETQPETEAATETDTEAETQAESETEK